MIAPNQAGRREKSAGFLPDKTSLYQCLTTRRMSLIKPSEFLARARPGHCGTTADVGDCTIGESGSFGEVTARWEKRKVYKDSPPPHMMKQAVRSCLSACNSCTQCNYVSISWYYKDCACPSALNHTTDSLPLRTAPPPPRSCLTQVRGTPRATRRSSSARPMGTGPTSSRQAPLPACRARLHQSAASRGSARHRGRSGSRCGCRRHVHSMHIACAWRVHGMCMACISCCDSRRPRVARSSGCSLTPRCASPSCSMARCPQHR